ncbi:MAG: 50S ribosomal protein L24 [Chloroflexi bacterium]|nr:50S ribosomal protein L24 [Chloroflexota bacterium]
MRKVRKNDQVMVLAGKDRGKQGKVRQVLPRKGLVIVDGVNMVKRHLKRRPNVAQSGIVAREAPLPVAKVGLVCPKCGKPTRVAFTIEGQAKVRVCKRCKQEIS